MEQKGKGRKMHNFLLFNNSLIFGTEVSNASNNHCPKKQTIINVKKIQANMVRSKTKCHATWGTFK